MRENDEITDLFRTRLADAGMNVRDGLTFAMPTVKTDRQRFTAVSMR